MPILIATLIVGAVGLVVGVLLMGASEAFKVEEDPREVAIRAALPGANCGGCGFPGCDGLAAAIANGNAPVNGCPVGGQAVADQIAQIMGVDAETNERMVAFVKCSGECGISKDKCNYYGIQDCRSVAVVPGRGYKKCAYGCCGFGTCVKACPFDAIHVIKGVAVVDREKCVACGKCVAACPYHLIELIPYKAKFRVQCNSHDPGRMVRAACSAGCIGCTLCVRQCPREAIDITESLAHINYDKCVNCGLCAGKCPAKVIRQPGEELRPTEAESSAG